MVLKTSDVKLPKGIEDIDDLNMHFEAQRKYNQKKDNEEFLAALPYIVGVIFFVGLFVFTVISRL